LIPGENGGHFYPLQQSLHTGVLVKVEIESVWKFGGVVRDHVSSHRIGMMHTNRSDHF
jgi:hypothetical protein